MKVCAYKHVGSIAVAGHAHKYLVLSSRLVQHDGKNPDLVHLDVLHFPKKQISQRLLLSCLVSRG